MHFKIKNKTSNKSLSKEQSCDYISKNLITRDLIVNILTKYIKDEECYILNKCDIYLISNYIFQSKRLQNFIKLNNLTLNDFVSLISSSKIISSNDKRFIYNEGESQYGFYILIKGSLLAKISKLSVPKYMDSFFKDEILQEYNLKNDSDIIWLKNNEIEEYENKILPYKFLNDIKMTNFSPYSSIFQQKHQERIKFSKKLKLISLTKDPFDEINNMHNEETELFIYNLGLNDCLFFGGVNIFNEYMRDNPQIHLTSVYTFNKKTGFENNNVNTIVLYISEDKIKELNKKISLLNKERTKFLLNKLKPLNEMRSENIRFFISTIKMIYINIEGNKDLINKKNIFYLVYQGSCWEKKKKEMIYDQGSFISLTNLFLDENKKNLDNITLYSKGSNVILFQIDLNYLSENNEVNMKLFLRKIFNKQKKARTIYINSIESYQNKKIKEKERTKETKYILDNVDYLFSKTNKEILFDKSHQNSSGNEKSLNNIYFNKNISKEIKAFKTLLTKKGKKIRYILKNKNKHNSNSNPNTTRTNISKFPFINLFKNYEKFSINKNKNQNPINNRYNCSTDRKYLKNNNIVENNNGINSLNCYSQNIFFSSQSSSYLNKEINKRVQRIKNRFNKKKSKSDKNMFLRNIHVLNINKNNLVDFPNEETH